MDSGLERVVVVLAGYNPETKESKAKNKSVEKAYGETLVDTKNKAAFITNTYTGEQTIEHVLDALGDLGNTHVIVVGNNDQNLGKDRLENIINKKHRPHVVAVEQMGGSISENIKKGLAKALETMDGLSKQGRNVSTQIYSVLGDAVKVDANSLKKTFDEIDRRNADVTMTYCEQSDKDNGKRGDFLGRPNGHLKNTVLRNSNISAINTRLNSEENHEIILSQEARNRFQMIYDSRKLLELNTIKELTYLGLKGKLPGYTLLKTGIGNMIYDYNPRVANYILPTIQTFEEKFSTFLSTPGQTPSVALMSAPGNTEVDLDSEMDMLRFRKEQEIAYMIREYGYNPTTSACRQLYQRLQEHSIKEIPYIGYMRRKKVLSIHEIGDELELMRKKLQNSCFYHPLNTVKHLTPQASLHYCMNLALKEHEQQKKTA